MTATSGLVRLGRRRLGWRQADLGVRIGCSASTVSRLEASRHPADIRLLTAAATAVGLPPILLAAACGITTGADPRPTRVAPHAPPTEEDPMHRRTLLTAAGTAVPASLLLAIDDALAVTPTGTGTVPVDHRLAQARKMWDTGRHTALLAELPGLLGDAHRAARSRTPLDHARLSACYLLATQVLGKIGRYERARLTADRATTYAAVAESPIATAAAARELSIVLRHQDQPAAAHRLPATAPADRLFRISPAGADLYAVGVHWALGDAGAALEAGRHLRPDQFPTPERTSRMHTDLARAWWQYGKPEQTARELLAALRVSPSEVRDRPSIRTIVSSLSSRHLHTPGVRELALALTR
ncbi:helix-turn-helix domain-containing protein [Streptomyces jumonjinensis]|uniref:Helix-turn-helix transcriptional regulator n=1 Tax=Streptomyces jumonjinensis TaxID=1945 RepID=A0A646KDN3_STRJU|nr:helix-turn-helix transcriptional regulator [Streptomyces jumonjinensis]MQS99105.1 helix-turn-helix transcriptional regulator [Streptomyces jumonjinensis]